MGGLLLAITSLSLAASWSEAAIERSDRKVVCYYTTWSFNRPAPYNFSPSQIDPFICTHIIYAFADIGSKNNLISSNPDFDFNQRGYANITGLKVKNKDLKVMIGIGGWAKLGFERITANETNRKEFAKNAVRFLRKYKFDGLDLNWQHPTFRDGGIPEDRQNYVLLAQTLREEIESEAMSKNKPKLLLSIAITHNQKFLSAYDISSFNNYMDFISVICYDYHFSYEAAVNHHAPLYSLEEDTKYDANININYTIQWFSELADPEKLVMGIPTYGRSYKLDDPAETRLGSYADGAGDKGPITGENGFFAYFEICNFVQNEGWTVMQTKPGSAGPYAFKGDQWVCYDDLDMIRHKADYANAKNLGGIMFWTVDYDDFLGKCQNSTFPLIRTARDALIPPYGNWVSDNIEETEGSQQVSTFEPPPIYLEEGPSEQELSQSDLESLYLQSQPSPQPSIPTSTSTATPPSPQEEEEPSQSDLESLYLQSQPSPQPSIPASTSTASPPSPQQGPSTSTASPPRPPQGPSRDPQGPAVSGPQSNILADLVNLIEKAGGIRHLSDILRSEVVRKSIKKSYNTDTDNDNSLVLESLHLPPLLLIMNNSSIYIKEFNVYQKP